jgi:amino acid permease
MGVAIVLSLFFHFTEHKNMIITCCFLRILVILTMIVTAIYSYTQGQELDSDEDLSVSSSDFDLYGIGVTSSIMFLTIGYHILIPEMIQPLKNKEKNAVPMVLIVLTLGFLLSVALGITMCLTLSNIEQQITLNWKYYSNGENPSDRDWWAYIIDGVISVFPAIDVLSQIFLSVSNVTDNIVSVTYADLKQFDVDSTIVPLYFYDLGYFLSITGNLVVTMNVLFINSFALASLTLVPQKCPYDNFIASKKFITFYFILTSLFMIIEWVGFISFLILD